MEVTLKVTVDEVNMILRGLSKLTIAEAGAVHNKVFGDSQTQMQKATKAAEKETAK